MRTIAQEAAFQRALRNCSKEAEGRDHIYVYVTLVKGEVHPQERILRKVAASLMKAATGHMVHMSL